MKHILSLVFLTCLIGFGCSSGFNTFKGTKDKFNETTAFRSDPILKSGSGGILAVEQASLRLWCVEDKSGTKNYELRTGLSVPSWDFINTLTLKINDQNIVINSDPNPSRETQVVDALTGSRVTCVEINYFPLSKNNIDLINNTNSILCRLEGTGGVFDFSLDSTDIGNIRNSYASINSGCNNCKINPWEVK
jgi:hypothetical protein